jgi:hypothetical protein
MLICPYCGEEAKVPDDCGEEEMTHTARRLGEKMGFDYMTVRPIDGKGIRFFSAVPTENETQREERLQRDAEEEYPIEIRRLEVEIKERQAKLEDLLVKFANKHW